MLARWAYQFFTHLVYLALSRLWVRLSLAFSAVAFISVASILVVITLGSFTSTESDYSIIDELERPGGTIERLTEFYESRQNWREVGAFLQGVQSAHRITPQYSVSFSFRNAAGELLFTSHPSRRDPDTIVSTSENLPIHYNGEIVGTLSVMQIQLPDAVDWQAEFLNWLSRWLWLIVLAGVTMGILSGVLISRSLAAPMSRLSRAAQEIGARRWHSRVDARGTQEVIQLASAFNEMAHDLEQAENLRRNMVADVAHELRTPLTVLQGNLRAIIDGVYPMDTSEIANLYDQTLVLKRLVNDLHELSQAEARKLPLSMERIDIAPMIMRIASTFESVAEEREVRILGEIEADLPEVRGDQTRISQVLNNLLDNALRHSSSGDSIRIRARRQDHGLRGGLCIEVIDNGQGIAAEHLPYVFERFYRADKARSRNTGGSGLGLAIARAIIEAHDGSISVYSAGPGMGATFTIELPSAEATSLPEPLMPSVSLSL